MKFLLKTSIKAYGVLEIISEIQLNIPTNEPNIYPTIKLKPILYHFERLLLYQKYVSATKAKANIL